MDDGHWLGSLPERAGMAKKDARLEDSILLQNR
jgi:hypothetical protein